MAKKTSKGRRRFYLLRNQYVDPRECQYSLWAAESDLEPSLEDLIKYDFLQGQIQCPGDPHQIHIINQAQFEYWFGPLLNDNQACEVMIEVSVVGDIFNIERSLKVTPAELNASQKYWLSGPGRKESLDGEKED